MLLLIYIIYGNINQMSENKNPSELSTAQRLMAIAGLASIAVTGSAVSPEQTDGLSSPINTNEQLMNISAGIPAHGIVDKTPVENALTAIVANPYKKSITINLPSAEKTVPVTSGLTDQKPITVILPPLPVETTQSTVEKVSLHPETMIVPKNVEAVMNRDTTYLTNSGCSGSLVRSKTGVAIGVVTAEHCGLRGSGEHSTPRLLGTDGNTYIVNGTPEEAMTGPDQSHLKSAGTIKEFFVPAANDISNDIAFGAFDGHTAQEVVDAYNHNKLSESGLSKLKLGDRMYISGWPVAQPENGGNFERQNFPLSYLGEEMVTTSLGETIHMIWAAVPTSKDGADCSFGDSGGKAFVMEGVHSRSVGVLSAFTDFTGKLWGNAENDAMARKHFEWKYNVNLSPFDAVCGIATEVPTTNEGATTIKPVSSTAEIPGYLESIKNSLIEKAATEFFDPNFPKTILGGVINVAKDGETPKWESSPAIYFDYSSGSAVTAAYNPDNKGHVEFDYINNIYDSTLYGNGQLFKTSGELNEFHGTGNLDGFIDQSGRVFGYSVPDGGFDKSEVRFISYDKYTHELVTVSGKGRGIGYGT